MNVYKITRRIADVRPVFTVEADSEDAAIRQIAHYIVDAASTDPLPIAELRRQLQVVSVEETTWEDEREEMIAAGYIPHI